MQEGNEREAIRNGFVIGEEIRSGLADIRKPAGKTLPTIAQAWRKRVEDLLSDPITVAVVRRDGGTRNEIVAAVEPIAEWLRQGRPDAERQTPRVRELLIGAHPT